MTAKAIALANEIASALKQRQALAVAVSFDTDNLPLVCNVSDDILSDISLTHKFVNRAREK